jgi:hypothetical protein
MWQLAGSLAPAQITVSENNHDTLWLKATRRKFPTTMQFTPRSFAFLGVIAAGCLALPVGAQTVTPSSGVWSTTTSGSTVTTSTVTLTTPPPFAFSF